MMSTYNGEKHLSEQIESILNQKTAYEIHIRIRDDGSKDRTVEIAEKYARSYPDQIEIIRGENLGYNGSFFYLIRSAEGFDYYSISDQDDVWLEDKLQVACDAIDNVNEDIPILYASTSYLVRNDLIPYGMTRKKVRDLSLYNTIVQNICPGHSQVMNSKLIYLLKDNIDCNRIYVYDSWIQNVANLFGKIVFDNNPHTYYRQYEGNQLGSGSGKLGQLLSSLKRNKSNDGIKYRIQIEYFIEKYKAELIDYGYYSELKSFVDAKTVVERIKYIVRTKLIRQNAFESLVFYCAVILGRF